MRMTLKTCRSYNLALQSFAPRVEIGLKTDAVVVNEGGGGGVDYKIGPGLVVENGTLRVNTANVVEAGNTLPVTSAAVAVEVGNIDALLQTI